MADQTEAEVIQKLSLILAEKSNEASIAEATGACVYNAGAKTYCNVLTKSQCNQLNGSWKKNEKCP